MRVRKWKRVTVGAAVAALVAGAVGAQEMRLPPGRWWENPRVVERLGLTQEQQGRIRDLVFDHAQRMVDLNAAVKHAELELARAVSGRSVDPATARRAFEKLVEARTALERDRFELLLAVRQVLTAEQWDRLRRGRDALRRQRREQRGMRRPGIRRPAPRPPQPPPLP